MTTKSLYVVLCFNVTNYPTGISVSLSPAFLPLLTHLISITGQRHKTSHRGGRKWSIRRLFSVVPDIPSTGTGGHSHRPNPSSTRRLWNITIPPRCHAPANQSIALQQRPKRSLFGRHSG